MTLADRLIDLNRWYEGLPDDRRIFVYPGVLLAAALVNARWTGSPFGWLFFAALAALVVIRRSYVSGYLKAEALADGPAAPAPRPFVAQPAPVQPVVKPAPAPVAPPVAAQPASPPFVKPTPAPVAPPVAAQPAPPPPPPAQAPVAAQPAAKPAPQPPVQPAVASAPTVDGPAPRPVPAAAPGNQKKNHAPPPRKNDGRSGRRKPGDKHP